MLRTILYSLISTSRSQHCKHFFKAPRVAILWRCSNMADECFNVAHKMREYY